MDIYAFSEMTKIASEIQRVLEESGLVWDIEYRPKHNYFTVRFGESKITYEKGENDD